MSVTIWDLPQDLTGMWKIALTEPHNDSFAGTSFVGGISQAPSAHWGLRALVGSGVGIAGLLRVDPQPELAIGDVSKLRPSPLSDHPPTSTETLSTAPAELPEPEAAPADASDATRVSADLINANQAEMMAAVDAAAAPIAEHTQIVRPTTLAELDALSDDAVRVIATDLGWADKRWGIGKIRAFVADELHLGA